MTPMLAFRMSLFCWFFFAALAGTVFLVLILLLGGSPVSADVYGPWVYVIPAWVWAAVQVAAGSVAALGALLWRWQLVLAGGVLLTLDMAFLSSAGFMAGPKGFVLLVNAAAWIGPFSFFQTMLAIMVARAGRE